MIDSPESELPSSTRETEHIETSQSDSTNNTATDDKVVKKKSVDDFNFGEVLGEGAYGAVRIEKMNSCKCLSVFFVQNFPNSIFKNSN
jgi:hypothetical protein